MKKVRFIPLFTVISFAFGIASLGLYISFIKFPDFADGFNKTVGFALRWFFAKISNIFPFSLAEFLLFLSPLILIVLCVLLCRYITNGKRYFVRAVAIVLAFPAIIYGLFVISFSSGYRGKALSEKLNLKTEKVSSEELYEITMDLVDDLNESAETVDFANDGTSIMYSDYTEISEKLNTAYVAMNKKYPIADNFTTNVKQLIISEPMTYTHLSGMYTFFTGEANVNTNYPDFITVYTMAHEMAHQRGISKEDEANFTAFLCCISSEDGYIKYCGYINMYQYLSSALYKEEPTLYFATYYSLDARIQRELTAYSEFFDKYRESNASKVSDSLNESYLKSQGTSGVKSYGEVVDLAVAFYKN